MGNGLLKNLVDEAASVCPRIHYLPPVPPKEVLRYAAGSDVGLSLIDDICLSYRYCLPNKLFETLLAGVPVLASDLPDQAEIVKKHEGGWVVPNRTEDLADFLINLDVDRARQMREDLPKRVRDLSWEKEREELLRLYQSLLKVTG
jgi:glycosyltransferase involved in cell wall biosynthesis